MGPPVSLVVVALLTGAWSHEDREFDDTPQGTRYSSQGAFGQKEGLVLGLDGDAVSPPTRKASLKRGDRAGGGRGGNLVVSAAASHALR